MRFLVQTKRNLATFEIKKYMYGLSSPSIHVAFYSVAFVLLSRQTQGEITFQIKIECPPQALTHTHAHNFDSVVSDSVAQKLQGLQWMIHGVCASASPSLSLSLCECTADVKLWENLEYEIWIKKYIERQAKKCLLLWCLYWCEWSTVCLVDKWRQMEEDGLTGFI